jgi:hypothetical protein
MEAVCSSETVACGQNTVRLRTKNSTIHTQNPSSFLPGRNQVPVTTQLVPSTSEVNCRLDQTSQELEVWAPETPLCDVWLNNH